MATRDLTKGSPLKSILLFALPIFLGNVCQMLYNFVDAIIVGRFISIEALGAIGATSSIVFMILSFIYATTQGFCVVLAQQFGAKNYDYVRKSYAASIILCTILAIVLISISIPYTDDILRLMKIPSDIFEMSQSYLFIFLISVFTVVFYDLAANTIRALGDSKTPLYFLIISLFLNIVLDIIFIAKCNIGVSGAALATAISQAVSALACYIFMYNKFPILRLKKSDWVLSPSLVFEHIKIGIPMGFQISILTFGKIILQFVLNKFGTSAISAFTVGMRIDQLFYQVYLALGVTMANYTAQNFGAGKISRIKEGVKISMKMVTIFTVFAILILTLFSENIINVFMDEINPEIVVMASQYLHTIMFFLFFLGTLLIYRNVLQGVGSVGAPVLSGVIELFVRGASAIVLAINFGYSGLCFATPLAWLMGALVLFSGYRLNLAKNFKKRHRSKNV